MSTSATEMSSAGSAGLTAPSAALLTPAGGAAELTVALAGVLGEAGWKVDLVAPERLWAIERERWDVIVILAGRVTEESLVLAARAARHPATRVALVSPDRDPLHIADILRSGVDDYLVAPFLPEECLARLTSLAAHARSIRTRHSPARHGTPRFADGSAPLLHLDPTTRTVRDGSARVALSTREWDVLAALLAAGEHMATASELAASIWGAASEEARVVSTISRLRRKLAGSGVLTLNVVTIRGLGYSARLAG